MYRLNLFNMYINLIFKNYGKRLKISDLFIIRLLEIDSKIVFVCVCGERKRILKENKGFRVFRFQIPYQSIQFYSKFPGS